MSKPGENLQHQREQEIRQLREQNELLTSLVRDAPVAIVSLDLDRNVRIWNRAAEKIFGWREDEVLGRPLPHIPVGKMEEHQALHRKVVAGEAIRDVELHRLTKDGTPLRTSVSTWPLRDFNNNIIGLMAVYEDVAQLDGTPIAPEIPFRGIVEQSLVGLYIIQDDIFQYANPRFAEMFGVSQSEFMGKSVELFIHPPDRELVLENLRRRISGEATSIFYGVRGKHREGRIVDIEVHGTRFQYRGRPAVIGVAVDVTESKRREEEIRLSQQRFQELSRHLISMREEARTNIAREVHDVLGGTLTALKMDLRWLSRNVTEPTLIQRAQTMIDLAQEAIETVRRISSDLRPGVLDNLGLIAAIEWEAQRFSERLDIPCDVVSERPEVALDDGRATAVFRIVQEALTNISRHAQAKNVQIRIGGTPDTLKVEIIDDGNGITPEQINSVKSYGILGMCERARQIGGNVQIDARNGPGARVVLTCPIQAATS